MRQSSKSLASFSCTRRTSSASAFNHAARRNAPRPSTSSLPTLANACLAGSSAASAATACAIISDDTSEWSPTKRIAFAATIASICGRWFGAAEITSDGTPRHSRSHSITPPTPSARSASLINSASLCCDGAGCSETCDIDFTASARAGSTRAPGPTITSTSMPSSAAMACNAFSVSPVGSLPPKQMLSFRRALLAGGGARSAKAVTWRESGR